MRATSSPSVGDRESRSVTLGAPLGALATLLVGVVAALVALDGGIESPFAALLFPIGAFVALFCSLAVVGVAGAIGLAVLATAAILEPGAPDGETLIVATGLIATIVISAWQAHNARSERRELAKASRSDPLTGCLNRRGFEERLGEEMSRTRRLGSPFVLIILDIDDFKQVNDAHGHAVGDDLLIAIARAMAGVVRGMDSAGRLGGDEFALLFPGAGPEDLASLSERVEDAVSPLAPCSVGAACFPADGSDTDALLHRADERMYADKREAPPPADDPTPTPTGS